MVATQVSLFVSFFSLLLAFFLVFVFVFVSLSFRFSSFFCSGGEGARSSKVSVAELVSTSYGD